MENPVLAKELRVRLRSRQPAPVRLAIALVVGGIILLTYEQAISYMLADTSTDTAKTAWTVSFFLQTVIIWLLCPAVAANSVTQEKEQQTWEMLVFSLLTPLQILTGKLLVRLLPVLAALLVFAPFNIFCILMGGVRLGDVILVYFVFAIWIAFMTTVSLFMSWAFKKTSAAITMSFIVLFALTIGTAILNETISHGTADADSVIVWLNPLRIGQALIDPTDYRAGRVILLSSMTFLGLATFLFWRMVSQFRTFSTD